MSVATDHGDRLREAGFSDLEFYDGTGEPLRVEARQMLDGRR